MKPISLTIPFLALLLFACNSTNNKIGYVESDRLLIEFKETKIEAKKIEENTAELRVRFDTLKTEFEQLQQKFTKNLSIYTVEERENTEARLNQKQAEVNRYYNMMSEKIREEDNKVTQELLKKINKVIKSYGEKNDYDFILGATNKGNIVYAKDAKNLTDEIIQELNQ